MYRHLDKIIISIGLIATIGGCCWLYDYLFIKKEKIVFINNQVLFDEFLLKKELEKEFRLVEKNRMKELDSLKAQLQQLSLELKNKNSTGKIDPKDPLVEQYTGMQEFILSKEEALTAQNESMIRNYDAKIWKQLNQYVKDFSKKNGYDYVLGSKGDGNIMFATEKNDVTEELVQYVNNRYTGKNE